MIFLPVTSQTTGTGFQCLETQRVSFTGKIMKITHGSLMKSVTRGTKLIYKATGLYSRSAWVLQATNF